VAYFLLPILAHHDPARVETVCYAEVDPAEADEMTARLRGLAHAWRPTFCQRAGAVADQVRADGIDVLVDLAGHTRHNRLDVFALKPAPVQVTYLGYPNTTGLAAVDYRLTDAVADPPGEPARHSEEVVRLPAGFCCYAPPDGAPDVTPLPARRNGRVTFGVFHHLAKLNAGVLDLWGAILRALPEARLLMARDTLTGSTKEAFARRFAERGVSGDRVELRHVTPKALRHLDLYAEVDIALDPFPWTGHTTACESAWMGVPVVTLRGDRHAGRMVVSVLTQLGLPELIGDTPEQYLAAAVRLAGDVEGLDRLRAGLRGRMWESPLCDGRGFTRGLEEAYRRMWRRWCAGGQA
jgi:protein O-GlcNAc transferase